MYRVGWGVGAQVDIPASLYTLRGPVTLTMAAITATATQILANDATDNPTTAEPVTGNQLPKPTRSPLHFYEGGDFFLQVSLTVPVDRPLAC